MSDPFMPLETKERVTLQLLQKLASMDHPAVISTKGDIFSRDEYLEVLSAGPFVVQISMSSLRDELMRQIDIGTPGPSRLLAAARTAADAGVPVSCRIQPLIPTLEADAAEVIEACATIGVRHVSVEYLKLPVERSQELQRLSATLGVDLGSFYRASEARRVGREWVLPAEQRLPQVLELRALAHSRGLTFGAADTDLLLLSDGSACCSGVDLVSERFSGFFRYTYPEACRIGAATGEIRIGDLKGEWRPDGTISRFVNSSSRIRASDGVGANLEAYIARNWNGSSNGPSPGSLYGVEDSGRIDEGGFAIYRPTRDLQSLLQDRASAAP
jgi:hypothetical protein